RMRLRRNIHIDSQCICDRAIWTIPGVKKGGQPHSAPSPGPISSTSFARARRVTDLVLRRWGGLCGGCYPAGCKPFQGFVGDGGKLLPLEFTQRPDELIVLSCHGSGQWGSARHDNENK